MPKSLFAAAAAAMTIGVLGAHASGAPKPTIVLVHGAFADSSSWDKVMARLQHDGYPVIAAANQLRSVDADTRSLEGLLQSIQGPIVLVGHSYGGVVITNAAETGDVRELVYVSAYAPDAGESVMAINLRFPGGLADDAIDPTPIAYGADLYVRAANFRTVFAGDLPEKTARQMQETQRPVALAALAGPSGDPAWRTIPSWFIYGSADQCIPPEAEGFMAERARARRVQVVPGASHVVMISHPAEVTDMIERAAREAVK
jgi:pimeloyl-ACP methyl ester carboxylesterase